MRSDADDAQSDEHVVIQFGELSIAGGRRSNARTLRLHIRDVSVDGVQTNGQ